MTKFRDLLPLYAVIFLGFFGYALTITLFIPMLMNKHFLLLPAETAISVRVSLSGLLLAMYPLGQFLGSPIIGNLSDHWGRKKVLLWSLILCVFGFASMALSIEFYQLSLLFVSAFLTGLCESNMAISQSIIADRSQDTAQKTKLIGYAYAACSLGYIIGPLLGGVAGSFLSYSAPFWITALGVLCIVIWLLYSFEDRYIPNKTVPIKLLNSLTAMKSIFTRPKLFKIYLINFLIFFAVQGLYRVVPLYVVDTWNPALHTYSLLISFVSLLCFLANLWILGKLAKQFTTQHLLSGLLWMSGLLVILITVPHHFNWIWLTFGISVIPSIMALPTCTIWLSEQVTSGEQGQVLGNNQALLVLGESTSAAIGGLIAAIWIPLPVIVMGLILLMTGIIIPAMRMEKRSA
jgi:predicted MFS family arabinose efflux permease